VTGTPVSPTPLPPPPGAVPETNVRATPPMPVPPPGWAHGPPPGADPRWYGRLSSPWRRLGAYLIDVLILAPAVALASIALFVPRLIHDPLWARLNASRQLTPEQAQALVRQAEARLFVPILVLSLGSALLFGLYTVILTRLRGQTVGKMAVGVKVVQRADGSLPSWGASIARWALPAAAGLLPWLGGLGVLLIYLWMLWDPNRQGLHDKLAKTVVIRT
jgi:uncharacterized RDD family membrane protein YckC